MPRNLDNRVELLVPIEDESLVAEIVDSLDRCFADDTFGVGARARTGMDPPLRAASGPCITS